MIDAERGIEVRQRELDAGEHDALLERLDDLGALGPRQLEVAAALLDLAEGVALDSVGERQLTHRQEQNLLLRVRRALGDGVEGANAFDRVADEIEAQGARVRRREDVDDAAANAELAAVLDDREAAVAPGGQAARQQVGIELVALHQVPPAVGEGRRRRHALQQGFRRGDDERCLRLPQVVEAFDARCDVLRRRRHLLEGNDVPRRQVVDAAGERRGVLRLAEKEAQIADQTVGLDRARRQHERRARVVGEEPEEEVGRCTAGQTLHAPMARGGIRRFGDGASQMLSAVHLETRPGRIRLRTPPGAAICA